MNTQDHIERIRQARALLAPVIAGTDEPQIEALLRNADMELHWALWNLGESVEIRAESGASPVNSQLSGLTL
jgi:hypothetical protein